MPLTNTVRAPGACRQSGVGLIEVLCAVVILSLGMFASTRMQLTALQTNQSALYRGNARFLAEDMVSRMRANRPGIEAGAYANVDTGAAAAGDAGERPASPADEQTAPGCLVAGCDAAALAQADIAAWSEDLRSSALRLPARADGKPARGTITRDVDGVYTVRLEWSTVNAGVREDDVLTLRVSP